MHCHLTDQMVEAADVIVAFKEFPHTDFLERAEDLVDLCLRAARGEVEPVAAVFDCRAIAAFMTSREPGRSFVDRIKAMEGRDGILSITVAHGFTAADVYDMGTKVLVYADGDRDKAAALAERLGARDPRLGAERRGAAALQARRGDRGGALPMAGAADRARRPLGQSRAAASRATPPSWSRRCCAIPKSRRRSARMWDPVAVSFCRAAGAGAEIPLRFGGKAAATSGPPIDATVRVRATTPDLVIPFEQSLVSLGPAAAITIGNLDVVLASTRAQTFSPPVFTDLGIDLAGQEDRGGEILEPLLRRLLARSRPRSSISTPAGPTRPISTKVTYTKVRRPLAPLDPHPWL